MQELAQNLVFGILVGSVYGLAAIGMSLVFGVMRVLNVAHGELLMIGGYFSFWALEKAGVDPFLSLPLTGLALVALGYLLYQVIFRWVVRLDEEPRVNTSLLVAFGLGLILNTAAAHLWTADDRSIITDYSRLSLVLGGIRIPVIRLAGLALALLTAGGLQYFLSRTRMGRAIRATAENWQSASLMGIDIRKVYALAFPLSVGLAGLAGTLVAVGYSISPHIGLEWTLKALVVVVLAGLGSNFGTLIAGIILGCSEAIGAFLFGGSYREAVSLLLFLAVLMFRPQGLFGKGVRMQ